MRLLFAISSPLPVGKPLPHSRDGPLAKLMGRGKQTHRDSETSWISWTSWWFQARKTIRTYGTSFVLILFIAFYIIKIGIIIIIIKVLEWRITYI